MIFLGTGASEMIPNPMCGCDVCRRAQVSGDPRERRVRTSFLLDEENLIDCGADVTSSCVREGISLQNLKNIFLTHTHLDHFSTVTLENLQMCITEPPKLNVFMSQQAYDGIHRLGNVLVEQTYTNYPETAERWPAQCTFIPVEPYQEFFVDDMAVSAVVGRHPGMFNDERSLNYVFRKGGKTFFYACDTGLFYPETFEYLKGRHLDVMAVECTFGKAAISREANHLNLEHLFETIDCLIGQNTVDDSTMIYLTHIGHKGGLLHEELNEAVQQRYGKHICAAYDGLRI